MPRRAARIAPAIFVNILVSIPLVVMARGETAPADNCLASPRNDTPVGSHWYYRLDHATKRNCWYLRSERGGVAQAAPQAAPPAPAPQPAAKPSLADARAELPPQATVRDDAPTARSSTNSIGGAAPAPDAGSANGPAWSTTPTAAVATRWPELPPVVSPPKAVQVATADTASSATQPVATQTAASVADLPIQPEMLPTLAAATFGALAFAGVATLIAKYFRRRVRRRKATAVGMAIWDTTDDDRIVLSDYPATDERDYRPRFARGVPSATSRPRAPEFSQRAQAPEFVQRAPRRARR